MSPQRLLSIWAFRCELELIPLVPREKFHGQHEVMPAPGGARRACVVCGTKVRYFCYGCGLDTVGQVHVCSPNRDNNRGCWGNLHYVRDPRSVMGIKIARPRQDNSPSQKVEATRQRKRKSRDSKRVDNEPKKKKRKQRRSCKKGVLLNPHHT